MPAEPNPGIPAEPPPGQPLGGTGPQVNLSGTVTLENWSGAPIRVDIFDGDQRNLNGPRPSVIGVVRLEALGAWQVSVPASASELWIGGYADDNRDGKPDHEEPVGWYAGNPVAGGAARSALDLILKIDTPPGQ